MNELTPAAWRTVVQLTGEALLSGTRPSSIGIGGVRTVRAVALLLAVIVAVGCEGRAEPARPSRALTADVVEVADHWRIGPCQHLEVTLRSGQVVDVVRANVGDPTCPAEAETVFLLGEATDLTHRSNTERRWDADDTAIGGNGGSGPLVLIGTLDGATWLGAISSPDRDCWLHRFGSDEGAWLEGETLHLASGLVLPLAADFRYPTFPEDPFPLRTDDAVCLNDQGEVVDVENWIPR